MEAKELTPPGNDPLAKRFKDFFFGQRLTFVDRASKKKIAGQAPKPMPPKSPAKRKKFFAKMKGKS